MGILIVFITRSISAFIGILAHLQTPYKVRRFILNLFIKSYQVDLSILEKPYEEYPSLGAFFSRAILSHKRPVDKIGIVSPVDGVLRSHGILSNDLGLNVKGVAFNWDNFLISPELSKEFDGGHFFNFYLSPKDYHHVHFPYSGKILEIIHHPGGLLPVNDFSVKRFPNLFCYNERVVALVEAEQFRFLVIMIGALNVGSIELAFYPEFERSFFSLKPYNEKLELNRTYNRGERFGSFRLGSSVVCVFPKNVIKHVYSDFNSNQQYGIRIADVG